MSVLTDYQLAALEYKKHISLTANAGSGKTTVLSKRYVEILINENISINNLVAITFTEKAASELYSKIATELDARISESTGTRLYRLELLRRSLVSAKISTIHSFCIDILKDYSPEVGIDANFSPIDARTADDLLDQSINEVITKNLLSDSSSVKNLIRIFSNKSQLIKRVKQLFNRRKSTEQLIETYYNGHTNDISNWFNTNFEHHFDNLFQNKINILIKNIGELNKIAEDYKRSDKQIEIHRLLNELSAKPSLVDKYILLSEIKTNILTQKGDVIKRGYLSNKQYLEYGDILDETTHLFKELNDIEIEHEYEKLSKGLAIFGKEIIDFYIEINERFKNKKQQKSYLDFEDLLLLTQQLLKNDEVKNSLSEKYKYIMIDEYQDTNETQYNIFMPILKNLSTGNLFVVGDEKQSIYMFREAEVEIFNKTKTEIKFAENETSILDLPHSFRLTPNIALFTNILFRKLLKNPNPQFNEVEYNELVCAYPYSEMGKVELILADEESITESENVARKVLQLLNNSEYNYGFGDITVLCSKRKNFLELEQIFTKYGIPFSIVGGKGFYQQQLIYDIYNYLSFLINPKNDLALATVLRAPYYGLSDVQLTTILLSTGNSLIEKLKHISEYSSIVELLEKHLSAAKILSPSELIRKINNGSGYWTYIASKSNSDQEIVNLEKLIQKAIYINEQGFHTLYDFVNYLHEAINNIEDEGQADLDAGKDSVKIMTIHQSKGLEFKVVILFKTNQKSFDEKLKSKEIIVDKNFGILSKLPVDNNFFEDYKQAPIIGIYNYIQKKKSIAELKRLLYVAITRAEQHLIVSAGLKKEKFWPNSFASMIFSSFAMDYENPEIKLNDTLTFMRLNNDKYSLTKDDLEIKILIEKNVEYVDYFIKKSKQKEIDEYLVNVKAIQSCEKNEIISASKISLFLNCPRKYELTYEFGYGELTKLFREESDFEFSYKEDEIRVSGNIVGSIAHSLLEKKIPITKLKNETISLIQKEESVLFLDKREKEELIKEITGLISKFYNSESYNYFEKFKNSYNEIEFYKRESDYYLYGIIDKLIVDNNKIIVIDYKSDKINNNNVKEKRDTYLNQLLFYSYILLNRYPKIRDFELRLVFIRDDKFSITKNTVRDEIQQFGKIIKSSVQKIRSKNFSDSEEGCKDMKYYLLNE